MKSHFIIIHIGDIILSLGNPKITNTEKEDSLRIIEDRQLMTLNEYKTNLEKITFDYNNLKSAKEKLKEEIKKTNANIAALKATNEEDVKKFENVKLEKNGKEKVLNDENKKLNKIQEEIKQLDLFIQASMLKLKEKGKSRLNAFQKSLEKEELKNGEIEKVDKLLKLNDQENLISNIKNEVFIIAAKEDKRRNNIRTKAREILEMSKQVCNLYLKLRKMNDELLTITDEMHTIKLSLIIVEEELKTSRNELSQDSNAIQQNETESIDVMLNNVLLEDNKVSFSVAALQTILKYEILPNTVPYTQSI